MKFATGQEAVNALKAFPLAQGKSMHVTRRSGMDRKLMCSSAQCTYTIQVYRKRKINGTYGEWRVHKCISVPKPTKHQIAANLTFRSTVNVAPKIPASTTIDKVSSRDGLSLEAHKLSVYRARDILNGTIADETSKSYQYIQSYLNQFLQLNPGSIPVMERDGDNRFKRALVSVNDELTHQI
ncbi:hypothetical protein PHMEG_00020351 [Phytophthora megakarya]|uniref:Uncharacterized protein n=1 Tax=Phytophthora megakarya TaxID=4795 RepID=A0A225VR48_9STRA|nr:hypothetical protein PHMEG_00020351 [Phytophthora megakarya]